MHTGHKMCNTTSPDVINPYKFFTFIDNPGCCVGCDYIAQIHFPQFGYWKKTGFKLDSIRLQLINRVGQKFSSLRVMKENLHLFVVNKVRWLLHHHHHHRECLIGIKSVTSITCSMNFFSHYHENCIRIAIWAQLKLNESEFVDLISIHCLLWFFPFMEFKNFESIFDVTVAVAAT